MAMKSVSRSACAAFAPDAPYLAAGTMAGAVDLQFSSSANLDLFKLDFLSADQQLVLAGSAPSSERFNRLSWGKPLKNSEEFSLGLVAGGLADGNIGLWNPKSLISGDSFDGGFIQNLSRHKGFVRGLEFNPAKPNLLASADEGEISIWDLEKPSQPTHYPPLNDNRGGEISFLSWNRQVNHILASTSYNGNVVVWDLNKQKSVLSFNDRRRCSVMQWNPDQARQLVVASDDDRLPRIRLWDLRNTSDPVKEFAGHTKGVISMAWCPVDSSYLLSSAKDNRTICWDVTSGEIVSELPAGTNPNFDVHWYPKIPGIVSASSYDGNVGLYNLEGCPRNGAKFRAPKWYKRNSGVSFGFGGKLVSFSTSNVVVQNIVTDHNLVSRCSPEFEDAMISGEKSCLRLLCEKKSEELESKDEKEIWSFLKIMFDEEGTARTKLLSHLGFTAPAVEENDVTQKCDVFDRLDTLDLNGDNNGEDFFNNLAETDHGEDFFNNLSSPKASVPASAAAAIDFMIPEEEVDESFDDGVERALVVGDHEGAVSQCISANRLSDALIIAQAAGDAKLWESTRDEYLKTTSSRYLKVVAAMANRDLMSLVNTRPLKSWKKTIALICTYASQDEWIMLCDALASRLMAAGETVPATLCFICAGNIDKAVEIWSSTDSFENLIEKATVLASASGQKLFSGTVSKLVENYAEVLASQGLLTTAMEFLKLLEFSPELAVLQHRVARAMEEDREMLNQYQQPSIIVPSHDFPKPAVFQPPVMSVPPPQPTTVPEPTVLRPVPAPVPQPGGLTAPTPPRVQPHVSPLPAVATTIQTADISNVAAQLRPVIATLTRLFLETSEASQPSKKREIDDNSRKLGALFVKLNSGEISRRAAEKLVEICQAIDKGELARSTQLQIELTATDWDECSAWLLTLKRMVKARQTLKALY